MSIRRTLLLFFLLMGLAPAAALTGLAFFQARDALELEITRNLKNDAEALMAQIDRMAYERVLHVHTLSHLEIMQEVRVGDVDKRLTHLLYELGKHYQGVYQSLYCTNRQGEIIAASDPALIGKRMEGYGLWLEAPLVYGETSLSPLILGPDPKNASIEMSAGIHDPQKKGEDVGKLRVIFDWNEIFHLLDQPGMGVGQDSQQALVLLFDADGRIIAASAPLRQRGLLLSTALASWRNRADAVIDDAEKRLGYGKVLAGSAREQGYQGFSGFGWTVQVYQPTSLAFAPIERMASAFFLLLCLTSAMAVILSLAIAGRIARPIAQLTDLSRNFMREKHPTPSIRIGKGEVGELTEAFLHMIGDLEKSRENLVRAAKLAVVGEMAAAMAHEVRTPLGIMRSSAQMLRREKGLSETGSEMLDFMVDETDRLNRLITSLLDCARPRPPRFAYNHLHDIAQRVMELLSLKAQQKNISIHTQFDAENDLLSCDEEQILQVLLNLLMNALQILPPGGSIILRTHSTEALLELCVDDDGPGIAEPHRTKIFDPFFTQRDGGIGLGLTVVQQIIRAHGAEIIACASPEGGARFHVFFPLTTH